MARLLSSTCWVSCVGAWRFMAGCTYKLELKRLGHILLVTLPMVAMNLEVRMMSFLCQGCGRRGCRASDGLGIAHDWGRGVLN